MPKTLIEQFPKFKREAKEDSMILDIAELFCDTIQGEGIHSGVPATFIRLQHCTLQCIWCDTLEVWKKGNPYSIEEILDLLEENGMIEKFKKGQHIVLTGGSPLRQEQQLLQFCRRFRARFGFIPYYEVENECVKVPSEELKSFISTWNNSPKLGNSMMRKPVRYKPEAIKAVANRDNSWFKFVVNDEQEWQEIYDDFIDTGLIKRHQIILMPQGQNQEELESTREFVADMAVREGVRFCDRLHITIWNKKTGV